MVTTELEYTCDSTQEFYIYLHLYFLYGHRFTKLTVLYYFFYGYNFHKKKFFILYHYMLHDLNVAYVRT